MTAAPKSPMVTREALTELFDAGFALAEGCWRTGVPWEQWAIGKRDEAVDEAVARLAASTPGAETPETDDGRTAHDGRGVPSGDCGRDLRGSLDRRGSPGSDLATPPPTAERGEVARGIWQRACVGREGYCSSDLQDAALWAIQEAFRVAERAARSASLPPSYQWSEGNREKFDFGRDSAADAILSALSRDGGKA